MTVPITARIDEDTQRKLEQLSEAIQRSRSWLIADAVKKYVEEESWQIAAIEEGIKQANDGNFASESEIKNFFGKWGIDAK